MGDRSEGPGPPQLCQRVFPGQLPAKRNKPQKLMSRPQTAGPSQAPSLELWGSFGETECGRTITNSKGFQISSSVQAPLKALNTYQRI